MRTKSGVDTLSFDDLYNNLRVFEFDVKGFTRSSSSTQNVAFVSSDNTSSTNEVDIAYGVSTSSGHNSQKVGSSSYTDDLIECRSKGNQDSRRRDAGNTRYNARDNEKRLAKQDEHKAMVTIDQEAIQAQTLRSSDVEDIHVNDRFIKVKGMHAVPPPMTRNYMPPKYDFGIDESKFTYGPKQSTSSESDAKTNDLDSCDSSSSEETLKTMPKPVKSKPKVELNKQKGKSSGPRENRPVWNNVQRLNHQNKFVLTVVLTKIGRFPVNVARQNFTSQATSTHTARKVNTARPKVNKIRPRHNVYKSHSPIKRPFNKTTAPKANFTQLKVNTAGDKLVSAIRGKWKLLLRPQQTLKGKGIIDSGCSRHITRNKAYLVDYQDFNGGPDAFGGSKGQITGKGKIRTGKLNFEDVYFVKELQNFNLFFVSQMCDKKNKVLFTDTECLVLSSDFKLFDENQILLRVLRQQNMDSFNLEYIVPSGGLACLITKATVDESTK
nr:ribonuclease H-like domain-containing protein [Tanacetum cinerariifolium]